jgi:4'-phosphopantetheinyl transferase
MRWGSLTVAAARLDAPSADAIAILHPVELGRAAELPVGRERDLFLNGRIALRVFAAGLLDSAPGDLVLDYGCANCGRSGAIDHGRPGYRVPVAERTVLLSLSRSGPWCLLAGTTDRSIGAVGVDLEDTARAGFAGFDDVLLAPAERALLGGAVDGSEVLRARARLWSRKEAFLKATGAGLFREPSDVDASGNTFEGIELTDLDLRPLGLPTGLVAALAIRPLP